MIDYFIIFLVVMYIVLMLCYEVIVRSVVVNGERKKTWFFFLVGFWLKRVDFGKRDRSLEWIIGCRRNCLGVRVCEGFGISCWRVAAGVYWSWGGNFCCWCCGSYWIGSWKWKSVVWSGSCCIVGIGCRRNVGVSGYWMWRIVVVGRC